MLMLTTLKKWLLRQDSHESHTINPELASNIKQCVDCIDAICDLMPSDQTSDGWRVHFAKIKQHVQSMPNQQGLNKAFQTWQSIQGGMGSWNDYYIPHPDQETMRELNDTLQQHCATLHQHLSIGKQ